MTATYPDTERHCPICGRWMDFLDWSKDGTRVYECPEDHTHGPEAPRPKAPRTRCLVCGKSLPGVAGSRRRCPACANRAAGR